MSDRDRDMREYPKLLMADKNGEIFDVAHLQAAGMKAGEYFKLRGADLIELHPDSEVFLLPERTPVGYDPDAQEFVELTSNPLGEGACFAVSAFLAPGFSITHNAAYTQKAKAKLLPLFSYAAVAYYKGKFYASAIRVDKEKRQELSGMDLDLLDKNVKKFRKEFPLNRLVRHLETCALRYGCPAAKNFFLERYEGPLPSSPVCNARCIGCITHQPEGKCSVTQPRITFTPSAHEIAEVAISHIGKVNDPVVSFGQGCEGEPLMVGETLLEAVKLIRRATSKGVINMNTNASRPDVLEKLFDAGLNSIRVSLNSLTDEYYNAYYLPKGYTFKDVLLSIKKAKRCGVFVSLNYLTFPGFTDSRSEVKALKKFLASGNADMIQWRNLNYDPVSYIKRIKIDVKRSDMIGMRELISEVKDEFPNVMKGYFNPSRGRITRHKKKG